VGEVPQFDATLIQQNVSANRCSTHRSLRDPGGFTEGTQLRDSRNQPDRRAVRA
jgi:hypothetical protein